MYGQGYSPPEPPQQQRSGVPASVIVLRVLFALLPLLSLGLLTWGTALRIALMTRRALDWVLFVVSVVVFVVAMVLMPDEDDTSLLGDLVVGGVLLCAVAFTAYFLVVDLRRPVRRRAPAASAAGVAGAATLPPGYPQPFNPYARTVPQHPYPPQPGYGYPQPQPQPQPHQHQPQPLPTAPPATSPAPTPRIDQVRAELDELSDLLRKDEGGGR
ncbi:hypothetical protein ACFVQ4_32230 [Streptomyces laurentii]|uniref:hypothetical protein n=1 Tax=Streptomyces laurentii TaxID=39478 RepID=UPI0036B0A2C4